MGYSPRQLVDKLGLKAGQRACFVAAPEHYPQLLGPLPDGAALCSLKAARPGTLNFVHCFSTTQAQLEEQLETLLPLLARDGMLWVSWPRKAAAKALGIATDLTEGRVRELALPLGLVDIKVCAVDDVWSGLKFVIRRELRRPPP